MEKVVYKMNLGKVYSLSGDKENALKVLLEVENILEPNKIEDLGIIYIRLPKHYIDSVKNQSITVTYQHIGVTNFAF